MTRLTNGLRDDILRKIMKGLPNVDYAKQIRVLIQDTIIEFAPKQVQELYADEATRGYLQSGYAEVRDGNCRIDGLGYWKYVYGLTKELSIQMDERTESLLVAGTMHHAIYWRLKNSGLVSKYKEQEELRADVVKRLKANLAAATTLKNLYTTLEPELHGYIPKELEGVANLPANVAPVVGDLRKLGANLPEVPKAVEA